MKHFLIKVILFVFLPAISFFFLEALLPPTTFTHRHWEAISFRYDLIPSKSGFYPNINHSMNAVGDLCHHTNKAIVKKENWLSDKLGFRNNKFITQADVVIIGDSFTAGSSLNQDEIIGNKIQTVFNNQMSVYNMAPSTMSEFDKLLKQGVIKKPKIILYEIAERKMPESINLYTKKSGFDLKNWLTEMIEIGNINVYLDKGLKHSSIEWATARVHGMVGKGLPAVNNPNMFFLLGKEQKHEKDDCKISANTIKSYKKYCDSLGIKFIFLPMPDKESVYYELVPFDKQPNYLLKLDSLLQVSNVPAINTLEIYNNYRKTADAKLLYHYDDSHWNSTGVELMAKEIALRLKELIP